MMGYDHVPTCKLTALVGFAAVLLMPVLGEAQEGVASISESEAVDLADKSMVFAIGDREMPFTNQNFLLSFSLPNFYFHATTTYDILRMLGVPLGKRDFLGRLKLG